MKVSELNGALLDYWVAKAEGATAVRIVTDEKGSFALAEFTIDSGTKFTGPYFPSTQWGDGRPIIERECISTVCWEKDIWGAFVGMQGTYLDVSHWDVDGSGPTVLIAAMRAYVASKYGDEVPDESK